MVFEFRQNEQNVKKMRIEDAAEGSSAASGTAASGERVSKGI